jgi:proteic killer suppression protein
MSGDFTPAHPETRSPYFTFNASRYMLRDMIKSFKCKHTQALFAGERCHRQWQAFQGVAERKLQMLHRATRIEDLRVPPQNRLEALKADRKGQWSIRINDQWRICFAWTEGDAHDVEIVDYH